MAKKKKNSRSKKQQPARRSPFWAYSGAVVLVLSGIFVLIGGFNGGGTLPITLYEVAKNIFGLAALVLPVYLVYWGAAKFISAEQKAPTKRLTSLLIAIILLSGLFDITVAKTGNQSAGGAVGGGIGSILIGILDKVPAVLVLLAAIIPATMYAFRIPMSMIADFFKALRPEPKDDRDTDLNDLKVKAEQKGFKINEGLQSAEEPEPEKKLLPRRLSLKNSAEPVVAAANQEALTTTSDPDWQFPPLTLLNTKQDKPDAGDVNGNAAKIHSTFANFNIDVEMLGANIGPRVTQYTLKPPSNVKLTKITALENNLALDLAAHSIRMEAPIPGQQAVGIEVPNQKPATVRVGSLFGSKDWNDLRSKPLSFVIGKDISGKVVTADLAKMPHLLVAGQTGSGKSVMINDFLTSLLYHSSPSDLKLILVDPKQVEMAPYNDMPHLLCPVINEPEKCISALKWAVAEMERRLRTMAEVGKRNIDEYNTLKQGEGMPYIVIVIDELADLMMMAARDVEALIVRLAQKARAAGIHLVLATQRPSVDVITGLIKANIPARIAFTVASQVDSRTIIDQIGAEKLLGRGDMLLLTSDMAKPKRVQAALIEDGETAKVTDFLKMQRPPAYDMEIISQPVQIGKGSNVMEMGSGSDADSDMFHDAVRVVIENKKASTSLLQRRLRIGYGRAARLIEEMEEQGIIGAADGSRPREVLVSSLDQVFGGGDNDGEYAEAESVPEQRLIQ